MECMYSPSVSEGRKEMGFPLFFNSWTGRGMKSYPLGLVRMMKSTSILSRSTWKSRGVASATPRKINMLKQTTKRCWNHITFWFIIEKTTGQISQPYDTSTSLTWTKSEQKKCLGNRFGFWCQFFPTTTKRCWTWAPTRHALGPAKRWRQKVTLGPQQMAGALGAILGSVMVFS